MGYLPAMAMKTVIIFLAVTFMNPGIIGSSKYFLLETAAKKSLGDHNHDYNHSFNHETVGKSHSDYNHEFNHERIGEKTHGAYNHEKIDSTGDDYTLPEVHGKWITSLPPKYIKMFNSLSMESKIKAEKRIMKDFKSDIDEVKKAVKSGKLEEYLKQNNDYFLDLHLRSGAGNPPPIWPGK